MRAPTTLGLAALLLLALGGLYLSHVSLAADPAHHAPQGDLLARLRATEQRAVAAEKLAADAIAHLTALRDQREAEAKAKGGRFTRRRRKAGAGGRVDAAAATRIVRGAWSSERTPSQCRRGPRTTHVGAAAAATRIARGAWSSETTNHPNCSR